MGSRDIRKRETKKPKKGAVKVSLPTVILAQPVEVEVIKKGKKARPEDEEEGR